jgi:hypothetical protein
MPHLVELWGEELRMNSTTRTEANLFRDYALTAFDEMFAGMDHTRPHYNALYERFSELPPQEIERRSKLADGMMRQQGITFTVYGRLAKEGSETQSKKCHFANRVELSWCQPP